jgi:lincosamide nucleotidyltransferase A/C/D/E
MKQQDVIDLLRRFQASGVSYWVDGGWGVDALLGEQTRDHSDLDLVVHRAHLAQARRVLQQLGFAVLRDWLPNAIALQDAAGREVDLHPVDPTADGGGDQIQLDGTTRWHYSPPVAGVIGGQAVHCCPVADQLLCHLGYEPRQSDYADMRLLAEHFGVRLPPPYDDDDKPVANG